MLSVLLSSDNNHVFQCPVLELNRASKPPPGHPMPPAGQAVGSKCPFLAAEMGQNNNRVVREAHIELQEDVQEMNNVRTSKGLLVW